MKRSTVLAVCILALTVMAASAQTYTELLSFDGNSAAGPVTPLTQGVDGDLYGTTAYGGTGTCFDGSGIGCGVVFKITPAHRFEIIYNFQAAISNYPINDLVLGYDGNLYGTTQGGEGSIFKVASTGNFATLHTFSGPDGADLLGGVIQGVDGNFYGTTGYGGTPSNSCPSGCGTVFKMTPAGDITTLYSFCPQNYCPDGEIPEGVLAEGSDGYLYGTTISGGLYKQGTIFKISRTGTFRLLYTFNGIPHGPGLILASDGNFYGRTPNGIYQLTPQGVVTVLPGSGGYYPPFMQGSDGNFYGTSVYGGNNYGYIFSTPLTGGNFSDLYTFLGYPNDGSMPAAGLAQHTNGVFYGTTFIGGNAPCNYGSYPGCGSVFSLDMGLPPFVTFLRGAGGPGRRFGILGQGFTSATSVSLNGTPVDFKVKADTFIAATVPAGATTGYVTVTTTGGTLQSNVPFRVLK